MKGRIDVPALVTGLILLGFAALGTWILTGHELVGPASMWFASILMVAGAVGLLVSFVRNQR